MPIDATPDDHPITAYAGDTLTLAITVPAGFGDGYVWSGQIRAARDTGTPIDATFDIVQPVVPGDPGFVTLTAAESERLARTGTLVARRGKAASRSAVLTYEGVYDIQIAPPAPATDPVTTLIQGSITIALDVTQDAP